MLLDVHEAELLHCTHVLQALAIPVIATALSAPDVGRRLLSRGQHVTGAYDERLHQIRVLAPQWRRMCRERILV